MEVLAAQYGGATIPRAGSAQSRSSKNAMNGMGISFLSLRLRLRSGLGQSGVLLRSVLLFPGLLPGLASRGSGCSGGFLWSASWPFSRTTWKRENQAERDAEASGLSMENPIEPDSLNWECRSLPRQNLLRDFGRSVPRLHGAKPPRTTNQRMVRLIARE